MWAKHEGFLNKVGMSGQRDDAANGLLIPDSAQKARQMKKRFYHCGSHAGYSAVVNNQVQKIRDEYENGDISSTEAANKISALQDRLRTGLNVSGGKSPIRIR
ncbi:AHH domain-containing protein [Iodobacter ciconiae]|uniref:AHH domain-containing protein n=1 Tax=Iodobacter ciconiae TaxID=2496266 RepID=UPI001F261428|nr:AHH domain-containing protein [Iodobacter ciconiae]